MRQLLLVLFFGAFFLDGANAQLNQWQRVHPADADMAIGGPVLRPSYDSNGKATALSSFGYFYHRDSAAAPWVREEISLGFSSAVFVEKFSHSRINDQFVFATVRNRGIIVKRGADEPWVDTLGGNSFWGILEAAPSSDQVAYAAQFNSFYRTTDGGLSWASIKNVVETPRDLAVDPVDPATLLLISDYELFRSTDSGDSVTSVQPAGLPTSTQFLRVEFNPVNPDIAVAVANIGVYRSIDGGQSWAPVASDPWRPQSFAGNVVFDPVAPDTMYIFANNVYQSSDGGLSWATIADDLMEASISYLAISNTGERLFGTSTGSYTAAPGLPFVASDLGWSDVPFTSVEFAPENPDTIYATSGLSGLIAREPTDLSWSKRNSGLATNHVQSVWASPEEPGKLLLATFDTLYSSNDSGLSWSTVSTIDTERRVREIVVSADGTLIFAVRNRDDLLRSDDGGQTWTAVLSGDFFIGRDRYPALISPALDGNVYAGTREDGILKSSDSGLTWNALPSPFQDVSVEMLLADPFNPDGIYALVDSRDPWYSADAGATWENLRSSALPSTLLTQLAVDSFDPGRVYASFDNRVATWMRIPSLGVWTNLPAPRLIQCRGTLGCRTYPNPGIRGRLLLTTSGELFSMQRDNDGDQVGDNLDNCVAVSNTTQLDTDNDGFGNRCDADIAPATNDCTVNVLDLGVFRQAFFTMPGDADWNPDADFNGDSQINAVDLGLLRSQFFQTPGPSAVASCN